MTLTISLDVDRGCDVSLTRQVQEAIRTRIETHVLRAGTRLPSTRQLAADLGVSRSVAVEAYEQLTAEGYLACQRGSGTVVAGPVLAVVTRAHPARVVRGTASPTVVATPTPTPRPSSTPAPRPTAPAPTPRFDLRAGRASVVNFPRTEWLACYRAALLAAGSLELDYPSLLGHPMLREELARYLGRVREVAAEPSAVMVTSGFAQGLALLCEALPRGGIHQLGVEDPGHTGQRRFIRQAGMSVVPLPVDDEGLVVDALVASGARAVLVTPAHQFPTGHAMSPRRREQLLVWARDVDGLVIEDDYDGDLWLDSATRQPALQGRDPGHVVYAGTTSKALVPGMRLGWLVLPPAWRDLLRSVRSRRDLGTDGLSQRAFAEFVATGVLDRHLRRVRSRYRSRRAMLREALETHLPSAEVLGLEAGIHAYLRLPSWVDEQQLVAEALRRSVLVDGGQDFQLVEAERPPALVISYGAVPPSALEQSVVLIGEALTEQQREWAARAGLSPRRVATAGQGSRLPATPACPAGRVA